MEQSTTLSETEVGGDGVRRKNEKTIAKVAVRPEAIKIRKDEFFKNARSQFHHEPLESLEKSIQSLGLLKQLCVERDPANPEEFILIAGERRHLCLMSLKKKDAECFDNDTGATFPASYLYEYVEVKLVAPKNDIERLKIMVAENGEHSKVPDWDIFNFALWLDAQKNPDGSKRYDRPALCEIFNKSAPWISHTLQIASLPERVKACLKEGSLSRTAAVNLLSAKEDQYEFVLKYAESVIVRNATQDLAEAQKDKKQAEIEAEVADCRHQQALKVGDRIQARMQAKLGNEARRKQQGASNREERAKEVLANPTVTEESVKQALEENPQAVEPGTAPKTRSAHRVRVQVKNLKSLLDGQQGSSYIVNSETGKKYFRRDVQLIIAAYEQVLGKKTLNVFALLDDEYAATETGQ